MLMDAYLFFLVIVTLYLVWMIWKLLDELEVRVSKLEQSQDAGEEPKP